jgi:ABC-type uncharacterized transport system ATPase subunit
MVTHKFGKVMAFANAVTVLRRAGSQAKLASRTRAPPSSRR